MLVRQLWQPESLNQDHSLAWPCLLGTTESTRPPQVQKAEVSLQAEALLGAEAGAAAIVVGRRSVVHVFFCTFGPITCSGETL